MFAIEVEPQGAPAGDHRGSSEGLGRIVIGDFAETFKVPLGYWSDSDYRQNWRRAFEILKERPDSRSCLMASMTDPENSNFLICWPMYREGDAVHIQNAIIFMDEAGQSFDDGAPWTSIGPRHVIDEDGNRVSEWTTSMKDIEEFFEGRPSSS